MAISAFRVVSNIFYFHVVGVFLKKEAAHGLLKDRRPTMLAGSNLNFSLNIIVRRQICEITINLRVANQMFISLADSVTLTMCQACMLGSYGLFSSFSFQNL